MQSSILRDMLILGCILVMVAMAIPNRQKIYSSLGLNVPSAQSSQPQLGPVTTPLNSAQTPSQSAMVVSIPKSQRDGQFWTHARVNSGHVHFLIDTGATSVALTAEDARKAGFDLRRLEYDVQVSTAGGINQAARVEIDNLSVGNITLRDVDALIIPEGLSTSLLGMSFLGELQKLEATPNALIMRL